MLRSLHDQTKTNRRLAQGNADDIDHIIISVTMIGVVGFIFVTLSFVFLRTGSRSRKRLNNGLFHLFRENGIRPSNEATPFALLKGPIFFSLKEAYFLYFLVTVE